MPGVLFRNFLNIFDLKGIIQKLSGYIVWIHSNYALHFSLVPSYLNDCNRNNLGTTHVV